MVHKIGDSLYAIATGRIGMSNLSGPIGIGEVSVNAVTEGAGAVIMLMAALSVSLALFNMLPLYPLDGGQFVIMLYEWIGGSKPSERSVSILSIIGFMALGGITLIGAWNDLVKLVR